MTNTAVLKWKVMFEDEQDLHLPKESKILSVAEQRGSIVLYALVPTVTIDYERRKIYVHGTGHPVNENAKHYIGTVKLHDGDLMFHVFADRIE